LTVYLPIASEVLLRLIDTVQATADRGVLRINNHMLWTSIG
jgi:hypothetical protein